MSVKDPSIAIFIPSTVISAILFAFSAVAYAHPSLAPCLFFMLCGFGILLKESLMTSSQPRVIRHISDGITLCLVEFSQDTEKSEAFMSALSESIRVVLTNDNLKSTLRDVVVSSLRDEGLQSDIHDVIRAAVVRVSEDVRFCQAIILAVGRGASDAMSDKEFVAGFCGTFVKSVVLASKNEELREALLNVTTEAVSTAVRDERFMGEFKQAMKDCLSDSDIFRAGASGLLGAVLKPCLSRSSKER